MRTTILALLLALAAPAAFAAEPAPQFSFPAPGPAPAAPVPADAAVKLSRGQYYVIRSAVPLLVDAAGAGEVSVTARNGSTLPLTLPVEWAVGWPADPADPDFVTFKDPYLYLVRAVKTGSVTLQVIPALNRTDDKGKQIPLTRADIVKKALAVDAGAAPPRPDPPPVTPADPLAQAAAHAYAAAPATVTKDGVIYTKDADRAAMAAVFRALADAVASPSVKTAKNLYDLNANSMAARLGGRLGGVGTVLATDFGGLFPPGTKESYLITPADREAAKARLTRYAEIVEALK